MLNNFYHGKWGSEKRTDIALKCQTLQVNQKPEVAILHNNLYHINSDGINVNNLRCWSVRDIFTSSKKHFSHAEHETSEKPQTTHKFSRKYKLGFKMTLIIFFNQPD